MRTKIRKKLPLAIIFALIIQCIPTFSEGEARVLSVTPQVTALAEETAVTTPTPEAGTGTPTPEAGTGTPTPEAGTGTPTPEAGTGTPTPEAGAGTPTPEAGTGTPTPEAGTPTPPAPEEVPKFFMVDTESQQIGEGKMLEISSESTTIGIMSSLGYFPSEAKVEWLPYNTDILELDISENASSSEKYIVKLKSMGPGYSTLSAQITYGGKDYLIHCQIHIPLDLMETDTAGLINYNTGSNGEQAFFGMLDSLKAGETTENKVLQLASPLDTKNAGYSHYIPLFKYISYADGITSSVDSSFNGGKLINKIPALKWTSSNPLVATVDVNGYIKAVGSGYTVIRVETTTKDNNSKADYKEFRLVVAPTAHVAGDTSEFKDRLDIKTTSTYLTLVTDAIQATELEWELHKETLTGELLNLSNNPYMKVNISDIGDGVSLSEMKAGVYYLVARSSDEFSLTNIRVRHLEIRIFVPVVISTNPIVMNVGDYYDVLAGANILNKSLFRYTVEDGNGNISNIAEISQGIVTGLADGSGVIRMYYRMDDDIFGYKPEDYANNAADLLANNFVGNIKLDVNGTPYYEIPLTVIDGISLNMTVATMYVNSTLQLQLKTSNNNAAITWASEDESILTVDEDGLVTAHKVGSTKVTVSQVIHGVTKKSVCSIRVIAAVTKITLDPTKKELSIGDLLTINASVEPKINEVVLHWVSSDDSVVTIEQSGALSATVKAQAGGNAVVSAINQENIVVGSCLIMVHQPIKKIVLSQTKVVVPLASKQFQLFATVEPEEARGQKVVWKSTDPSIITVDQFGMVTLKKAGTASIICSSAEDGNLTAICNVTVTKSVAGIKLDQTVLNMNVGETFRMTYVITPADASDVAVTWTSTNNSIVKVDAKGLVTATGVGQATIILKTADGGFIATCIVNVSRVATAVKLDVNALTMNVGDYYYLEATVTPADSTEKSLIWETSDKSVAVISNKGKIMAKKAGVTVIVAKTKSGSTAYCTVTVQQGVTSVKLSSHEENMVVDDVVELKATVSPKDATVADVVWTSSNKNAAIVDDEGEVTAMAPGVSIITCTTVDGGYVDYCVVIVEPREVKMDDLLVSPESYLLGVGKTYPLTATILPDETTNKTLKWVSEDESIVTVDKKGRITGVSVGSANVYCLSTDGSDLEAYCEVEVCNQIEDIMLNYDYLDMVEGEAATLTATLYPENATYGVTWESADTSIAVVTKNTGRVTALKEGKTQIVATANDSGAVTAICYVKVTKRIAAKSITVSESELVMIAGEQKSVGYSILPIGNNDISCSWSSDNEIVASVDETTGLITARSMGTANISITSRLSGAKATVKVYVVGLSKTSLTLPQYSATIIDLQVYGASKSDLVVKWLSDNEQIAEVGERTGKVTARKVGTTTIYAIVNGRRLPCKVRVTGS